MGKEKTKTNERRIQIEERWCTWPFSVHFEKKTELQKPYQRKMSSPLISS